MTIEEQLNELRRVWTETAQTIAGMKTNDYVHKLHPTDLFRDAFLSEVGRLRAGSPDAEPEFIEAWAYGLQYRPVGPGAVPHGLIPTVGTTWSKARMDEPYRFGVIFYAEELPAEDVYKYELVNLGKKKIKNPKWAGNK